MSKKSIQLGDEVKDVTSLASGIAIGRIEYLAGNIAWIIQPFTTDDNIRIDTISVPDAYAVRVGDGVRPKPKPPMGFHARNDNQNGG